MKKAVKIDGNECHNSLMRRKKPLLSYDETQDYNEWKAKIKEKFIELLGIPSIEQNAGSMEWEIEEDIKLDGYRRIRFVFESEVDTYVPCYLLIPDTGKEKYPLAICLQGHSTGFHLSVGEEKFPDDYRFQPRASLGLQAVKEGYIALCIEQRAMGERKPKYPAFNCGFAACNAFMLGRTLIGERCWDISRAIDLMVNFPQVETENILITGNSGGGTASYYAACYDERIKLSAPSCSFCSYHTSTMAILHCGCNCIPHAYEYFEMEDLACLIAPRKLLVVAGKKDVIFPIDGVRDSYKTVEKIYEYNKAENNCALVEHERDHYWDEAVVWSAIKEIKSK